MPLIYDWLNRIVKDQGGGGTAIVYRDTYLSWRGLCHRVDRRARRRRKVCLELLAGHRPGRALIQCDAHR
jgi:hypothetical protein